ncbi:protein scd2/ral3, partial [Lipomyces chichibuensis]|uniref:protein scd2/ral3 n=1 Tax=Lipomyces chichibuensis TaxID=1546026 RepID=UPI00334336F7
GLRRSLKGDRNTPSLSSNSHHSITQKSPLTILPPKKVIKALYDYNASAPGELSFSKGDFFHVIGNENDLNWYEACNPSTSMRGMVPVTYFQVLGRNERESVDSNTGAGNKTSSTSSGKRQHTPLYGVVQYNFVAERPDELEAYEGDAVIVVAQSNHEWFVAKPIGRLGGPGLIPISYVEIRDMTTGKPVENIEEAIAKAGVPRVEEWKKRTAEYKASSIPLGKFEDDHEQHEQQEQQVQQHEQQEQLQEQPNQEQRQSVGDQTYNSYLSGQFSDRLSEQPSENYEPAVISAIVDRFSFDNNRYWYLVIAEMEDGTFRNLCRYYEDFYDFQIRLLDEYPDEAGRTGRQRILPFIPGPVTFVNDSISSQRRANLDEYVQKLIALPPYISRSTLVKGLFALRAGDAESQHAGSSLPQPYYRDSRPIANSGQSSQRINTVYSSSTVDQASARTSRPRQQQSMDRLRSESSPQLAQYGSTGRSSNLSDYSAHQSGQLKIKVFYQEDLIAIKVPVDVEYSQLENKLHERLGSSNLTFYFHDEQSGQHYLLNSNEDLAAAVGNSSKLVLYAQ